MRKLPQRGPAPAKLRRLQDAADRHAQDQSAKGEVQIKFRKHVYGCNEVRSALDQLQSGTCIYCEANLRPVTDGHVDHYRPKGGYTAGRTSKLVQPGYFLHAYKWENLVLSCPNCNDGFKKNHFPLADESSRNTSTVDVSSEDPLFIDAFRDEPRDHIRFRSDVPFAVGGSLRGNTTIDLIGLDRQDLNDARRKKLKLLFVLKLALQAHPPGSKHHAKIKETHDAIVSPSGEFASCIFDYISSGMPEII